MTRAVPGRSWERCSPAEVGWAAEKLAAARASAATIVVSHRVNTRIEGRQVTESQLGHLMRLILEAAPG